MKSPAPTSLRIVGLAMLIGVGGGVAGCTTAPAVDRGYPAAWPGYVALSPKSTILGTELNGRYANDGVVLIPGKAEEAITLTSLIPPQADGRPQLTAAVFAEAKEITLRVVNFKQEFSTLPGIAIDFIADAKAGKEGVHVEAIANGRAGGFALTYGLTGVMRGVPMVHYRFVNHEVSLTKAVDGSLIAEIQDTGVGMSLVFIPYYSQSRIWARFSPRPIGEHGAATGKSSAEGAREP